MEPNTCRDVVFDAFRELERRTERDTFRLQELVNEVLRLTNRYPVETIRTQISSVMCANAPVHHANHTDDLDRVGHGLYRRIVANPRSGLNRLSGPEAASVIEHGHAGRPFDDWFWEGNVQEAFARHLVEDGWEVRSISDTATREQGADIVAYKGADVLVVEVKGYPSDRYASGPKVGQPKPTNPSTQARHWYAGALLTASLARDANPTARVAMVFPDFTTYRSLVARTATVTVAGKLEVFFVSERGDVAPPEDGAP